MIKHLKRNLLVGSIGLLTAGSMLLPTAFAYEGGDFIARAGATSVQPNDDSGRVANTANTGVSVEGNTTLGFTLAYMLSPKFGLELLGALPFEHDIEGDKDISALGKIGSTKHLPPTLSVQFYPMGADSKIQPYLGVGINHTFFFDEETEDSLNAAGGLVNATVTETRMHLDPTWGYALQAGVDVAVKDSWLVNAAVWYIDIETNADLTLVTDTGAEARTSIDVTIDPYVFMLSAGYQF